MKDKFKVSRSIENAINSASRVVNFLGLAALVAMMLLTVADVFLRYVFKLPISDSVAFTEYLMVCVGFLTLAWCAVRGGHVTVDIVVPRFSPRTQAIFDSVTYAFGISVSVVIVWRSFVEALSARALDKASVLLSVPVYPFYLVLSFGSAMLALVMLSQFARHLYRALAG
jgi:TRAP-type C4-dicarboxylate transport system permease small subunit